MKERNGVRVGQRVRDVDGRDLGSVRALYDWGFEVARGFMLFRKTFVARYDEVRGERNGALVLARSARDLFDLAAGGMPASWRIAAPAGFPVAATPAEARYLFDDIATGFVAPDGARPSLSRGGEAAPLTLEEERRYVRERGQGAGAAAEQPPAPG